MARSTMFVAIAMLVAATSTVGDQSVPPGGIVSGGRARIHRMTLGERRAVGNELSAVAPQQLRRRRAGPSTVGAGPPSSSQAPGGAAR
jgi:hypothetical protein